MFRACRDSPRLSVAPSSFSLLNRTFAKGAGAGIFDAPKPNGKEGWGITMKPTHFETNSEDLGNILAERGGREHAHIAHMGG